MGWRGGRDKNWVWRGLRWYLGVQWASEQGVSQGLEKGPVGSCFQTARGRNNAITEGRVGWHPSPHQPLLFCFRPMLKALDKMSDRPGCESRDLRGSSWKPPPLGEERPWKRPWRREVAVNYRWLCVAHKDAAKGLLPLWKEPSAKALIRSWHSHPAECSRSLG